VCSPLSTRQTRRNSATKCLPEKVISKVASAGRHGSASGGGVQSSLEALAKELGCKSDDERCIVEKSLLSAREKKALLDAYFRPEMPKEWKNDPDMWLSSEDISAVMKQYESEPSNNYKFLRWRTTNPEESNQSMEISH
jgi:hypothetical protein